MSEASEKNQNFGMTIWDLLYRFRIYVFVFLVMVALAVFSQIYTFSENDIVGIFVFIFFVLVSYWLSRFFGGFLMDLSQLEDGYIGMRELDLWEFETMAQKFVTFASDMGPLVVIAPNIDTKDKRYSLLEIAFNSKLAREIAEFQKPWFQEYLELSRVMDFQVSKNLLVEWQKLKQTLGLVGQEEKENESE